MGQLICEKESTSFHSIQFLSKMKVIFALCIAFALVAFVSAKCTDHASDGDACAADAEGCVYCKTGDVSFCSTKGGKSCSELKSTDEAKGCDTFKCGSAGTMTVSVSMITMLAAALYMA